jgi:hypothetical protein
VSLPPKGEARDRWLARCEAAALIWHCWRYRERQTVHSGMSKGNRVNAYRRPLRHIARFILIALYILELGPARLPRRRPMLNTAALTSILSGALFIASPLASESPGSANQPPSPIPPRLLAHLRRWKRRTLIATCFVEIQRQAGSLGESNAPYVASHGGDLADATRRTRLGGGRVPRHVPGSAAGNLWAPPPQSLARGRRRDWTKRPSRFGGRNGGRLDRGSKSDEKL